MSEASDLACLLAEEHAAILTGNFADISRLSSVKEKLLAALTVTEVPLVDLRRISAEVSRNQTLLSAAIDGVRAVNDRMTELRRARDGFEIYGPSGHRSKVGAGRPAFERKA